MSVLTSKVDRIDANSRMPKYRQVVNTILTDIENELFKPGQRIPSINETSEEYYLSRDTVEKAYRELSQRGVIASVPGKGYYVTYEAAIKKTKVLAVFNKLCYYKQTVYNALVKQLGPHAVCNLYVHNHDAKLFEELILDNLGEYDYYLIMPHFYEGMEQALRVIKKIPRNRLILLDQKLDLLGGSYGLVYQDFQTDIAQALKSGLDLLQKYEKLCLVYPEDEKYPSEMQEGFLAFCQQAGFQSEMISSMHQRPLNKGEVYVVLDERELVGLIKQIEASDFVLGQDIGIISYNDTPLKEVLAGGITVISTDHEKMGAAAARLVLNKSRERIHNPFYLIQRHSL